MKSIRDTERPQREFNFTLGADPEFSIFNGNYAISAVQAIGTFMKPVSTPSLAIDRGTYNGSSGFMVTKRTPGDPGASELVGQIGNDGASSTGEIRPSPCYSPAKMAENIGILYREIHKAMPAFDYTTLTISAPIGGHIHLGGTPSQIANTANLTLLGSFLLPIIASEHRISIALRSGSSSYGKINDFRTQSYSDTDKGIEIRALTPEWTLTEKLARSTLAYLGTVWHEITTNKSKLTKNPLVIRSRRQSNALQELFISSYDPVVINTINTLYEIVKTFELYNEFKEEIDYIFNVNAVKRDKEKIGWNIARGWCLTQETPPSRRLVLNSKKTSEALMKKNIDTIPDFIVSWNNDTNVQLFASELSARVVAHNWNLSNEYFLFGLRKGADGFLAGNITNNGNGVALVDGYYAVPSVGIQPLECDTLIKRFNLQHIKNFGSGKIRISPKDGSVKTNRQVIVIGIPHDIRAQKDINSLVSLIWDIEENMLPLKAMTEWPTSVNKTASDDVSVELMKEMTTGSNEVNLGNMNESALELVHNTLTEVTTQQ